LKYPYLLFSNVFVNEPDMFYSFLATMKRENSEINKLKRIINLIKLFDIEDTKEFTKAFLETMINQIITRFQEIIENQNILEEIIEDKNIHKDVNKIYNYYQGLKEITHDFECLTKFIEYYNNEELKPFIKYKEKEIEELNSSIESFYKKITKIYEKIDSETKKHYDICANIKQFDISQIKTIDDLFKFMIQIENIVF
jgi:hypothetical protein